MATRFEIVLHGDNPVMLRAAGEEALDEIERLENSLSLYRTSTEIAQINACAHESPVRVSVPVFRLLQHALQLCAETQGAFDITVGPLVRCWGFMGSTGRVPTDDELAAARARVGWQHVELDAASSTVRFARPGMLIDLGAIGKGYAIDCAVELLREAGVTSALVHGGTSSIYAIGHPPQTPAWRVGVRASGDEATNANNASEANDANEAAQPGQPLRGIDPGALPVLDLRDEALSVSAVWGKSFQSADRRLGHVIDPRTGQPAGDVLLAAVALPSTTETDALSTALLTMGCAGLPVLQRLRPAARGLVVQPGPSGEAVLSQIG
jgi:thiamine biosynthesis lipoprotein